MGHCCYIFLRHLCEVSIRRTIETYWRCSTKTLLGVSFEMYLRRRWNLQRHFVTTLLRCRCNVLLLGGSLLLPDVLENFRNMYLGIYELDPAHFHRLAWQAALKKTKLKLNLLSNFFNISLMVEKSIRGRICHSIWKKGQRFWHERWW